MVLYSFLKLQRSTESELRVKHNGLKAEMCFLFPCRSCYGDNKGKKKNKPMRVEKKSFKQYANRILEGECIVEDY